MVHTFWGVDGCRRGWLAAEISQDKFAFSFAETFEGLMVGISVGARVLVDIPIGLLDMNIAGDFLQRPCDTAARKLLASRHSSIFSPPCLEALYEPTYQQASEVNFRILGKKLSKQSWNIVPRIKEVINFLKCNPQWRGKVLESHPELSFQFLNNNHPLQYSKKTKDGIIERITILEKHWTFAEKAFNKMGYDPELRGKANKDDMVDALCLAVLNHYRNDDLSNISDLEPVDKMGNIIGIYL